MDDYCGTGPRNPFHGIGPVIGGPAIFSFLGYVALNPQPEPPGRPGISVAGGFIR